MEVGEAWVLGFEAEGFLLIEPFADKVQAPAREGDVVGGKGEQEALRRGGCAIHFLRRLLGGFEDEVEKLGEGEAELSPLRL